MTWRDALALALPVVLASCSFIDDFGRFTTHADAATPDAASPDAGLRDGGLPRDSGTDAGACPSDCVPACDAAALCVVDPSGCHTCQSACAGCDPTTCPARVCSQHSDGTCSCASANMEGAPCDASMFCPSGLSCVAGQCKSSCTVDADCTGTAVPCEDGYCGPGIGSEWMPCRSDGTCGAGLDCTGASCRRPCTDSTMCNPVFSDCFSPDPTSPVCWPTRNCDFVGGQGCAMGYVCRALDPGIRTGEFTAGCLHPAGALPVGAACTFNSCEAGAACISDSSGGSGTCTAWCYTDPSAHCPVGTTCMALPAGGMLAGMFETFMGHGVGLCR